MSKPIQPKAVVFDMDLTVTNGISWTTITELLGASTQRHLEIFQDMLGGNLPYSKAKRQLLQLWHSTGIDNRAHFQKLFDDWELRDGAPELIHYLRAKDVRLCLITGSVDMLAATIASRLGIENYFANSELVWDGSGSLVDFHYEQDQAGKKLDQFLTFCHSTDIKPTDCVAVGDSDNDVAIFTACGHGIAIGKAHPDLLAVARKHVMNLNEIMELM